MIRLGIGEFILIILLFFVSFMYEKKENDRKKHLFWVAEERDRLRRIASGYENVCHEYTEHYISKHNDIICKYSKRSIPKYAIDNLHDLNTKYSDEIKKAKVDYSENLEKKYTFMIGRFRENAYPDYMIDEYVSHLNNIADKYSYIAYLMLCQILEIKVIDE